MTDTKKIETAALASLTTGVTMAAFSTIHEAAEWLLGHQIWTHEIPGEFDTIRAAALAQFPDLPSDVGEDWAACREAVIARYGHRVSVARGTRQRTGSPEETARLVMAAPEGSA